VGTWFLPAHLPFSLPALDTCHLLFRPIPDEIQQSLPTPPTLPSAAARPPTHSNNLKDFQLYRNTDAALKQQLLKACPALYLTPLQHPTEGFASTTTLQLLTHLLTTYGTIEPDEVFSTNIELGKPWWSPPTPVESLFEKISNAKTFILAAGKTIDEAILVHAIYINFAHLGPFADDCKIWNSKPDDFKTWANAIAFFSTANRTRSKTTTGDAGFGHANAATTTTSSKKRTATDANLETANAATTPMSELAKLRAANAKLTKEIKKFRSANHATPGGQPTNTGQAAAPAKQVPYCHSHGYVSSWRHSSLTCRNKADGHVATATSDNQEGGSERHYTENDRRPRQHTVE
jgi:hypothetical protein